MTDSRGAAGGSVDRMIRDAEQQERAKQIKTAEEREFVGRALDSIAPTVLDAISDGVTRAMGQPAELSSSPAETGSNRTFVVTGRAPESGVQVRLLIALLGFGSGSPGVENVQYQLDLTLACRPRGGAPFGDFVTIRPDQPSGLGVGRPSVTPAYIQKQIEDYVARARGIR